MKGDLETRVFGVHSLERRVEGKAGRLVGYAARFNEPAVIAGRWREQVAPGTFARAIARDDVHALIEHDFGKIIGRNRSGTLRLQEDENGLRVEVDLPDTQLGRDLAVEIERGDRDQMSFGFLATRDAWDYETEPLPTRTIQEVELFDVSVVGRGAYDTTSVALRSLDRHQRAAIREKMLSAIESRIKR